MPDCNVIKWPSASEVIYVAEAHCTSIMPGAEVIIPLIQIRTCKRQLKKEKVASQLNYKLHCCRLKWTEADESLNKVTCLLPRQLTHTKPAQLKSPHCLSSTSRLVRIRVWNILKWGLSSSQTSYWESQSFLSMVEKNTSLIDWVSVRKLAFKSC